MRNLDAGRLFIQIRTQFRLQQKLQRRYRICTTHAGRVHVLGKAQSAPIFRKLCKTLAKIWNKFCVISTVAARLLFGSECNYDSFIQKPRRRHAVCAANAGRKKSNSVRVARQKFRNFVYVFREFFFAQIMRDLDAGRVFTQIQT